MTYKQTTQVPNCVFDALLPSLTNAELKIFLVVIRQTFGWISQKTGRRKERDRISQSQFTAKTGLSKRIVTRALQSLIEKKLLTVTTAKGAELRFASDRKGRAYLFYSPQFPAHFAAVTKAQSEPSPAHKGDHNKTNTAKLIQTKAAREFCGHIGELVARKGLYSGAQVG
jgi:phage replication O-like protein O